MKSGEMYCLFDGDIEISRLKADIKMCLKYDMPEFNGKTLDELQAELDELEKQKAEAEENNKRFIKRKEQRALKRLEKERAN